MPSPESTQESNPQPPKRTVDWLESQRTQVVVSRFMPILWGMMPAADLAEGTHTSAIIATAACFGLLTIVLSVTLLRRPTIVSDVGAFQRNRLLLGGAWLCCFGLWVVSSLSFVSFVFLPALSLLSESHSVWNGDGASPSIWSKIPNKR